jgi:RsiW-degrading membrane proteinase PrsW (M82 family)
MALDILGIIAVVLAAVIPPIIYMIWVRDLETCQREPYSVVVRAFIYGASYTVLLAILIETVIISLLFSTSSPFADLLWFFQDLSPEWRLVFLVSVVAPIVEEILKASGLYLVYNRMTEVENGIIYGVAIGLGFAATENILYLSDALIVGIEVFIVTAIARALSSTLLHASATGVAGYGFARYRLGRQEGVDVHWLYYLLLAILMHAVFNFFAVLGVIAGADGNFVGLLVSFLLATGAFMLLRAKVKELDEERPCPPSPPGGTT